MTMVLDKCLAREMRDLATKRANEIQERRVIITESNIKTVLTKIGEEANRGNFFLNYKFPPDIDTSYMKSILMNAGFKVIENDEDVCDVTIKWG